MGSKQQQQLPAAAATSSSSQQLLRLEGRGSGNTGQWVGSRSSSSQQQSSGPPVAAPVDASLMVAAFLFQNSHSHSADRRNENNFALTCPRPAQVFLCAVGGAQRDAQRDAQRSGAGHKLSFKFI